MNQTLGPLSTIGLLIVGIALLWAVRLAYRGRPRAADDAFRLLLVITGWLLIQIAVIGVLAQALFLGDEDSSGIVVAIASLIGAAISLVVSGIVVSRYRAIEWRSLMWTLAAAAERGVPLPEAARGFALERTDEIGLRVHRLADLLESGFSLPDALDAAACHLPSEGLLAIRYGTETGQLAPAIAKLITRDPQPHSLVRQTFEKFLYLGVVALSIGIVTTFMMLRIIPVFGKMLAEFDAKPPWITRLLIGETSFGIFWLGLGMILLLLFGLIVTAWTLLFNLGLLDRAIPGLNWVVRRVDNSLVLRALAVAVADQRPLPKTIEILSRIHPKRGLRVRLLRAAKRMDRGQPWTDCLRQLRLLQPTEAALFEAAERAGNLAWALEEMAESSVRRAVYRLQLLLNFLFPCLLLLLAAIVGTIVVGLFLPLVSLIQGLTPS